MGDECPRTTVITTRLLARFPHVRVRRENTHPYRRERQPILVAGLTSIGSLSDQYETVAASAVLYLLAKALHVHLPDMPLRRDTQALRFMASIPLIQRRKKRPSREEKSAFT